MTNAEASWLSERRFKRVKELRAALEPDGVNEQSKEYILDAAIDVDTQLSDDDADQQRSGDSAKNEASDLDFTNEVAERDGDEQCEQWLGGNKSVQQVHGLLSRRSV